MPSLAEKRKADDEEAPVDAQARPEELRLLEALLFASTEPLDQAALAKRMPDGVDIKDALAQLQAEYATRGVNLVRIANKWTFRTAGDLAWLMTRESTETRRLSRAAIEMLAIIAYHQPVTRAEIEEIRGVITSKGTLDVLLETGWIRPRGRRKTPGRPLTLLAPVLCPQEDEPYFSLSSARTWASNSKPTVALTAWNMFVRPVHRRRFRKALAENLPSWQIKPE